MARTARPPARKPPLSPTALWVGWGSFGAVAFVGFCFGVWAGTQRPKPPEPITVASAAPVAKPPTTQPAPAPTPAAETTKPPEQPPAPPTKKEEPKKVEPPKVVVAPPPPTKKAEPPKKVEPPKTEPPKVPDLSYVKDVMPVFRTHCLNCHGGVGKPKADIDVRSFAALMSRSDSVVPGNPKKSAVWRSIEEGEMPPPDKPKMTPAEKMLVMNWILGGAKP